jgi:hypothetical protein
MADDITIVPGTGGTAVPVATNEKGGRHVQIMQLDLGNDSTINTAEGTVPVSATSLPLPAGASTNAKLDELAATLNTLATQTTLANALSELVEISDQSDTAQNLLRQLVQAAISPAGFDRSLGRGRVTALVESGTVTTVSTVTTVTTVAGLTNIDGRNGAMLINQSNLSAWADCVRRLIT